jgi:hypothetical protein
VAARLIGLVGHRSSRRRGELTHTPSQASPKPRAAICAPRPCGGPLPSRASSTPLAARFKTRRAASAPPRRSGSGRAPDGTAQLGVERLDGVRGVDDPAHLGGKA